MKPEEFKKLDSRKRWDIVPTLKNVLWCCEECGEIIDYGERPTRMYDGERYCGGCDSLLTRRTGGGQCDPCNYTFKSKIQEERKEKIKEIFDK